MPCRRGAGRKGSLRLKDLSSTVDHIPAKTKTYLPEPPGHISNLFQTMIPAEPSGHRSTFHGVPSFEGLRPSATLICTHYPPSPFLEGSRPSVTLICAHYCIPPSRPLYARPTCLLSLLDHMEAYRGQNCIGKIGTKSFRPLMQGSRLVIKPCART